MKCRVSSFSYEIVVPMGDKLGLLEQCPAATNFKYPKEKNMFVG